MVAFGVSQVGISSNFELCSVTVLTHSCNSYRTDWQYWAGISSLSDMFTAKYNLQSCDMLSL
jgi:hypothetical protein